MSRQIKTIQDVVDWGLCTGCGACAAACDKGNVSLVNIESVGIRPRFQDDCAGCTACLSFCPGYQVNGLNGHGPGQEVGPVLEVWEGYAADPEIRFRASSGGALSALALYCLERENMGFALHISMDEAKPWTNRTVQSRNRAELLSRTGSRYAPASPCEGLDAVAASDRPCVFIGKPCDASAAMMMSRARPEVGEKLGLVMACFCAGTPSTRGTLDLVKSIGSAPEQVRSLHYRGNGWPGGFTVSDGNGGGRSMPYMESWGRLTRYRPWRCQICPDGLGEVADIACGDAWERFADGKDPGRSIIVVRTERGRRILHGAIAAKYLEVERAGVPTIVAAQPNLTAKRREVFGRLLAMRALRIPTPRFPGYSLGRGWLRLPAHAKVRSVGGTLKRIALRGLWRKRPVS